MRSRKSILESVTFKKQFQGTLADQAILETLLDIRQVLLNRFCTITESDLEEEETKNQ